MKTTTNRYRYNSKEQLTEVEAIDYGARQYSTELCRWLQVDPLAEKYKSLSSYNFCANNPLKFVDVDGRKIVFASSSSNEFKAAFAKAVQYLNSHGAGGMMAKLEKSDKTYYLSIDDGRGDRFNVKEKTIYWNPTKAILTTKGQELSPTTILNHEIDHALQYDKNPKQFRIDTKTKDEQYENKEEKRVITGSEQETAKKLGEIKEGEVTREDHRGTLYETKSPISTDWKYEIIVNP
ncbi:MAG: M91 family zinc metallopeptidase [Salinivirgaceae bacterium]|nr:M91 family zinc metallopeptidase [Salinivirgaceae bacterium]